jgi:hypothetical protein
MPDKKILAEKRDPEGLETGCSSLFRLANGKERVGARGFPENPDLFI